MRVRFFFLILLVVCSVSAAMVYLHTLYLKQTREAMVDQQVREAALALIDSQLGDLRTGDLDRADEIISDELGENRIGKFFVIRDGQGDVVFESTAYRLLPVVDIPQDPQWLTIEKGDKYIRVLNLKLPRINNRSLQVGVVLPNTMIDTGYWYKDSVVFLLLALLVGVVATALLTSILLAPIKKLAGFVRAVADTPAVAGKLPSLPAELAGPKRPWLGKDEFYQLTDDLSILIDRINRGYKTTRMWTYQMAHEIKTPLALLSVVLGKLDQQSDPQEVKQEALKTTGKLANTVSAFLSWAELESREALLKTHAVSIGKLLDEILEGMQSVATGRLSLQKTDDFYVFCDREHLTQLLTNLLRNSLVHGEGNVQIELSHGQLKLSDEGAGFPAAVLEHLGEPFNRGGQKTQSSGLGLAWVISICRLYQWEIKFSNEARGAQVVLSFPADKIQSI